jgi:hypothetical protein
MTSPLIRRVAAETRQHETLNLQAAYSDDGARGKQSSRKPEIITKARHARQHRNMQGARQLFEP